MVDKERDEREDLELKKIFNHYLDKRKEIVTITQFKLEDIFGDVIGKDNISQDQIVKLDNI